MRYIIEHMVKRFGGIIVGLACDHTCGRAFKGTSKDRVILKLGSWCV